MRRQRVRTLRPGQHCEHAANHPRADQRPLKRAASSASPTASDRAPRPGYYPADPATASDISRRLPAAAKRGRQPIVPQDDHDEEPGHDLAAVEGDVEARNGGGELAVEVRQAEVEDDADGLKDDSNRDTQDDELGDVEPADEDGCGGVDLATIEPQD